MPYVETYQKLVRENQNIVEYLTTRQRTPYDQMLNASLDVAIARLNTVLLNLIQHPLKATDLHQEVLACQEAITDFNHYVRRLDNSTFLTRPLYKLIIHRIGTKKFPKIKALLNRL
jgi:hypothetical protein